MPPLPRPSQLGKVAAVVSSIVLVSLYVAYRSGGQTTTTSLPGSKGGVVQINQTAASNPAAAPTTGAIVIVSEPQVIYSTKSAPVFKPQTFSGSKSAAVFQPGDTFTLTTQPTTAPAQLQVQPAAQQPVQQQQSRQQQVNQR